MERDTKNLDAGSPHDRGSRLLEVSIEAPKRFDRPIDFLLSINRGATNFLRRDRFGKNTDPTTRKFFVHPL